MKVGVGYLFGAKDTGLVKTLKQVETGFSGIGDEEEKATKSGQRFNNILGGLNLVMLKRVEDAIGGIGDKLQSASDSGSPTGEMESVFRQEARALDMTMRQQGIAAGIMGDELKGLESQAFSLSKTLNRSAEDIGASMIEFTRRGITPEELLGEGADWKDLTKGLEASGMSASQLADVGLSLRDSYSAESKEIAKFINYQAKANTALGIGTEAFGNMGNRMGQVDKLFARTATQETVEDVTALMEHMTNLDGLFLKLGVNASEVGAATDGVFAVLADESQAMPKMFAGLQDDFGGLAQQMGLVDGGGFAKVLKNMREGVLAPEEFAMKMATLNDEIAKGGDPNRIRIFNEAVAGMGDDFAFLIQNGAGLEKMMEEVNKDIAGSGVQSLKDWGDQAVVSGRGVEDSLTVAKNGLDDIFRRQGQANVDGFVGKQIDAYGRLGKSIEEATGWQKDLLGVMSTYAGGGIGAVLFGGEGEMTDNQAMLMEVFDMAGEAFMSLAPAAGILASIGVSFVTLGGAAVAIATTLGGAIATVGGFMGTVGGFLIGLPALITSLGGVGAAASAGLTAATAAAAPFVAGFLASAASFVAGFLAIAGAVAVVGAGIFVLVQSLRGELGSSLEWIGDMFETGFVKVANWGTGMLDSFTAWLEGLDPKVIADTLVGRLETGIAELRAYFDGSGASGPVGEAGTALWTALGKAVQAGWSVGAAFFKQLWPKVVDKVMDLPSLWKSNTDAMQAGMASVFSPENFKSAFDKLNDVRGVIGTWIAGLFDRASEYIGSVDWGAMGKKVGEGLAMMFGENVETNATMATAVKDLFVAAFSFLTSKKFWMDTWKVMKAGFTLMFKALKGLDSFVIGVAKGLAETLFDTLFGEGVGSKIVDWISYIGETFVWLQVTALKVFAGIALALSPIGLTLAAIHIGGEKMWAGLTAGWATAKVVLGAFGTAIKGLISYFTGEGGSEGGTSLLQAFSGVWGALAGGFQTARDSVKEIWAWMQETSGEALGALADVFKTQFETIASNVKTIWAGVLTFFTGVWDKVTTGLKNVGGILSGIAATVGITAVTAPSGDEAVAASRTTSAEKLLAQEDARMLKEHLTVEFARQNEILYLINASLGGASPAAGGTASAGSRNVSAQGSQGLEGDF